MALLIGQLSGRKTLRDLVENLAVQSHKLYHLGMKKVPPTTLARVNEEQPHSALDRHVCLPAARVAEVQIEARTVGAADVAIITDEFVRAPEPRTSI